MYPDFAALHPGLRREQKSRGAGGVLAQRRLGGGKAGDRHPERRARHVVEPGLVTERHRGGIATVLAANAELDVASGFASALDRDVDEFAHALAIERDERVDGKNAL